MIYEAYNSTDEFMFRSFEMHSRIFHRKNLTDYFMISSGTNQFSMPSIWKNSIGMEIKSDFLYRWYTASDGFQCISSAVKVYEDYVSSIQHEVLIKSDRRVCMTTGGSGAASHVFDYLAYTYHNCQVVLVGMNYSLYERLSRKHRFPCIELCNDQDQYMIPDIENFRNLTNNSVKTVFVFSLPNNPTGKNYDRNSFSEIIGLIKQLDGFVVLDLVCDIVISSTKHPFLESVITEYDFWNSCAVVNSFSKSDAVAGLRIGYVYGGKELINFCSTVNADSIMNPPTLPAFPIVVTCMFRCIYLNQLLGNTSLSTQRIIRHFKKLFFITSAVIPNEMYQYAQFVFSQAQDLYKVYISELLENERIMKSNYSHTLEVFRPYIDHTSDMENGFNFCVWFRNKLKLDELTLIKSLIDNTGVAILTESSFTLRKTDPHNYLIRFSTACDEIQYLEALLRMREYMEREVFIP